MDKGADTMEVRGLETAGSGALPPASGSGIVAIGGSGSVLMRRKLLRASIGFCDWGGGSCNGPVLLREVVPGRGRANCDLGVARSGEGRPSGRTIRSG